LNEKSPKHDKFSMNFRKKNLLLPKSGSGLSELETNFTPDQKLKPLGFFFGSTLADKADTVYSSIEVQLDQNMQRLQ
jgi:hypothetical protein